MAFLPKHGFKKAAASGFLFLLLANHPTAPAQTQALIKRAQAFPDVCRRSSRQDCNQLFTRLLATWYSVKKNVSSNGLLFEYNNKSKTIRIGITPFTWNKVLADAVKSKKTLKKTDFNEVYLQSIKYDGYWRGNTKLRAVFRWKQFLCGPNGNCDCGYLCKRRKIGDANYVVLFAINPRFDSSSATLKVQGRPYLVYKDHGGYFNVVVNAFLMTGAFYTNVITDLFDDLKVDFDMSDYQTALRKKYLTFTGLDKTNEALWIKFQIDTRRMQSDAYLHVTNILTNRNKGRGVHTLPFLNNLEKINSDFMASNGAPTIKPNPQIISPAPTPRVDNPESGPDKFRVQKKDGSYKLMKKSKVIKKCRKRKGFYKRNQDLCIKFGA